MRPTHLLAFTLVPVLACLGSASCASSVGGGSSGAGGGGTGSGSGSGSLRWYTTCGDPICRDPGDAGADAGSSGLPACTTEKAGEPCATEGQECDPGSGCGVSLRCTTSDPKANPGGCPVSRARFKKDIAYLPDAELASLHDELMTMRLATWRYKGEDERAKTHLGFIIDDDPASAAVDATGDRVDLYGYTSMVAAAAQVEHRRVEALEKQVHALEAEIAALRAAQVKAAASR